MEFGFAFQYPGDWSLHANSFKSPFSKFNLIGASPEEGDYPNVIIPSLLVNIVTSDFADRAAMSMRNLGANESEIVVSGIRGIKYEYTYEGGPTISIIFPLREYRAILSSGKRYEGVLGQMLATFEILR